MKRNVLVLFGGKSGEHEISLISAAQVLPNIDSEKYNVIKIGITKGGQWYQTFASPEQIASGEWESLPKRRAFVPPDRGVGGVFVADGDSGETIPIDVAFPVMHGTYCEDGCIQGLFELAGIPYVGSGVLSSALCMDKGFLKIVLKDAGIPQAGWVVILKKDIETAHERVEEAFSYPVFVKPCNAGSSLGASAAYDREGLMKAVYNAAEYDTRILVEEYIPAREIECAVLGNDEPRASILGEIIPSNEFYDYNAKYVDNASVLKIPAPVSTEAEQKVREYAVLAYQKAGCKGFARVDFFVHKETGNIYLNEINTIPGFTQISMYPKLWDKNGIPYPELIDRLLTLACEVEKNG